MTPSLIMVSLPLVHLVCFVYLVYLVDLVGLVSLVSLVQANKQDGRRFEVFGTPNLDLRPSAFGPRESRAPRLTPNSSRFTSCPSRVSRFTFHVLRLNALQLVMPADSDLQAAGLLDAELGPENFHQTWLKRVDTPASESCPTAVKTPPTTRPSLYQPM